MRKNREGEYTVEREFLGQIPWEEAVLRGAPGKHRRKNPGRKRQRRAEIEGRGFRGQISRQRIYPAVQGGWGTGRKATAL